MGFRLDDRSNPNLIQVCFYALIDNREILRFQEALFATPGFRDKDQFVDFSEVESFAVTTEGMITYDHMASGRTERKQARENRRCAILAPDDLAFGTARVLQSRAPPDIDIQIFRERSEALEWLGAENLDVPPETSKIDLRKA